MEKELFLNYQEIKKLSLPELLKYTDVIRNQLIKKITNNTGHFSSSLGCIEIIVAMHYVFDALNDNFIFDIGHQSDAHKFLTSRYDEIAKYHHNDSSVFLDYKNDLDKYDAGHSSTAIAIATGMRISDRINNKNNYSISLIGDASFNGLAFSSWNNIALSTNNIVIINDNNMSISKTVGILHNLLKKIKNDNKNILNPEFIVKNKGYYEFDDFIIVSNVDGHNLEKLINLFQVLKNQSRPVIIHIVTTKGKGHLLAEQDQTGDFHYFTSNEISAPKHSVLEQQLIDLAKNNNNYVLYNPATTKGSGLVNLFAQFPKRTFDVGINEDTALLLACGSALKKIPAFVPVYSSFFQRAYDQLNHDVNRLNANVNIILNKTGLHAIGATHHGIYDINLARNLNNVVIVEPNSHALQNQLLKWVIKHPGPTILRTLKDSLRYEPFSTSLPTIILGKWPTVKIGVDIKNIIISYGELYNLANEYSANHKNTIAINAIFIKPLDQELLLQIKDYNIIVLEEQLPNSGIGSMINDFYLQHQIKIDLTIIGLDFKNLNTTFGKNLYHKAKFDKIDIITKLNKLIQEKS